MIKTRNFVIICRATQHRRSFCNNPMFRVVVAAMVAATISACATGRDWPDFRWPSDDPEHVAAFVKQMEENARSEKCVVVSGGAQGPLSVGIVAIGNTGVLRRLDGADLSRFYAQYEKSFVAVYPGDVPHVSKAEFEQTFSGWTTLTTWYNFFLGTDRIPSRVLVPANALNDVGFPSSNFISSFFALTGDLVAARSNKDGVLVLDRVLCRDGPDYNTCASQYQRGVFDGNTGRELAAGGKPAQNGHKIDLSTHRVLARPDECIPAPPDHSIERAE